MNANTGIRMSEKSGGMKKMPSEGELSFKELEAGTAFDALDITDPRSPVKKELAFSDIEKTPYSIIMDGPRDAADEKKDLAFRKMEGNSAAESPEECRRVQKLFNSAKECLFNNFQLIKEGKDFSAEPIVPYAKDFALHMQKDRNPWIKLIYEGVKDDNIVKHTAIHCLHTAIVALRIGIGLRMSDKELETLAMMTFLHDVGMLTVSPEIINKPGRLTSSEMAHIKKHPENGYRILKELKGGYTDIAQCAYQEHERHDGSGYPNGLKNGEILNYSSVVGISDIYAAMVQPVPYRARFAPFDAIKEIIVTSKGKFPANILRVLVSEFSGFPQGIYVKLNSKEIGKVIAENKLAPLRPVIEIIYDADGQKIQEPRTIDLMKDQVLQIKAACFTEDVNELWSYFETLVETK